MAIAPRTPQVPGAPRVPVPYGLFSVLVPRPSDSARWEGAGVVWDYMPGTAYPGTLGEYTTEVQTISLTGAPTGGTFTLTYQGQITAPIAYSATSADVQSALEALSNIGTGNVSVSGTSPEWTVTFTGDLRSKDLPLLTGDATGVTPAGSTIGVAETTQGGQLGTIALDLEQPPYLIGEAHPFSVYGRFKSSTVARRPDEIQQEAINRLQTFEERQVEAQIWAGNTFPGLNDNRTEVGTYNAGVTTTNLLFQAFADLEDFISDTYGSQGLMHMSRRTALMALKDGSIEKNRNQLVTKLGTPVIAGTGYDNGEIRATPPLFAYQSEIFTSSNRTGDLFDRGTNDLYALAERSYLIGFDPTGIGVATITE